MGVTNDHPLFDVANLYHAYRRCRRRKRGTINCLRFEQNLEANLIKLSEELQSGTYIPSRTVAFLVEKPKRREIFAADFRDRVVHHLLVDYLEPAWERRFIHDSYACRKGRGTHSAVKRLQSFLRRATFNNTRSAWFLQIDIHGFFISIDRHILFARLQKRERDPAILWLIKQILFTEPTYNCIFRGHQRGDFLRLPTHKSLFHASVGQGLPLGNLTSQFFANVYLDKLDQFVKHELKAHYYIRYCDDMVFIASDLKRLRTYLSEVEQFLHQRLHLNLNPRIKLAPVTNGIDFLGYVTRPHYILIRRRVVNNLKKELYLAEQALRECGLGMHKDRHFFPWPRALVGKLYQVLNSYLAHFSHADSYRLVAKLFYRFYWLSEFFILIDGKIIIRFPIPRYARTLRQQIAVFRHQAPGHRLIVGVGSQWRIYDNMSNDESFSFCERQQQQTIIRRSSIPSWTTGMEILTSKLMRHCTAPMAVFEECDGRIGTVAHRALTARIPP